MGVSFSISKAELIQWRTLSQRTLHVTAPIELTGYLIHTSRVIRWLGYVLSPTMMAAHHVRHRLSLAEAPLLFVKRLS